MRRCMRYGTTPGALLHLRTEDLIESLKYKGNVCISGLTAAGKTTHAHLLAGEFGLIHISGSQIHLNLMGLSPVQPRDFWISSAARDRWNRDEFQLIDADLLRLEAAGDGYVFDTSTMPWRHKRPALCVWLESSIESRVIKSIVSHRGTTKCAPEEYFDKIATKDKATIELYRDLYGIEIGKDFACFDVILDIGSLMTMPTLQASLRSIAAVHAVLRAAVGWYLTGNVEFREEMERVSVSWSHLIKRNRLLDSCMGRRQQR
jgi:cytidylate kinase